MSIAEAGRPGAQVPGAPASALPPGMRILCVIPTMGPGGAERVMSHLITHFSKQHAVTLLTFESKTTASFYPLPASVDYRKTDRFGCHRLQRAWRIISRPRIIRQTVKALAPDAIISFTDTTNITALLACLGLKVPVIISERIDPSEHRIGWAKDLLRAYTYPRARMIVVPSCRVAEYFPASLQSKIRIIGNPIPVAPVTTRASDDGTGRKRVIAVGRYEPQKGFDLLLDAFALIAETHLDWDLVIIGEGPERPRLEAQMQRLQLEARVTLKGVVPDIFRELANSHVMACPSRYEGFPNALAEGLAAGLPAVGYRGVSGVEDLVIDGKTGLLLDLSEGAAGLARALSRVIGDSQFRAAATEAAFEHIRRWAPDHIFALWEELLAEATGRERL